MRRQEGRVVAVVRRHRVVGRMVGGGMVEGGGRRGRGGRVLHRGPRVVRVVGGGGGED